VVKDSPEPQATEPTTTANNQAAGGSKVGSLIKAVSGGRISQLIGKVSAQGSKSSKLIFAQGIKAGSGNSGRALAAVGIWIDQVTTGAKMVRELML